MSEGEFLAALGETPATNAGALDAQVVVVTVRCAVADRETVDVAALEAWLTVLQQSYDTHVSVSAFAAKAYATLYGESGESAVGSEIITCRLVRQQPLDTNAGAFVDFVTQGYERMRGVDPRVSFFYRSEGSADYVRLLREIPSTLHIPGL